MAPKDMVLAQQPDLFKPIQAINAVLILICLGSSTAVPGVGVLWFIGLCSLSVSTVATVLYMINRESADGSSPLSSIGITMPGGAFVPFYVIEFVYSSILTLLCGVGFWLSFGYAGHVPPLGHSAGYVFAGLFLIAQTVCYALPVVLIYDRTRNPEHEPIADVHPFGMTSAHDGAGEHRYQTIQPEIA